MRTKSNSTKLSAYLSVGIFVVTLRENVIRAQDVLRSDLNRSATKSAPAYTEVPFRLVSRFAIVARGTVGDAANLYFLIDTGSSSTVVDQTLCRKLHLHTRPKEISVFERTSRAEEVTVPNLRLGPIELSKQSVVVRDLSPFEDVFHLRIDVIVGEDVLSNREFTVDFENKKLIWGATRPLPYAFACDPQFPFPTVALKIGGRRFRVFVDTGASELAIFENRTGPISDVRVIHEEIRMTLTGPVVVKTVEFRDLALGPTQWTRREGSLMDGSIFDGTLGPKWLGVKRIKFDFDRKVVSWEW